MKALLLSGPGQLDYVDVPDPEVDAADVLIEVRACGICGSDIHGADGSTGRRISPIIMGHEAAGVIRAVGPAATGWAVGDRVAIDSTIYCGACSWCRAGRVNLCDARRILGVSVPEYRQHGAWAEYVAVPARIIHRLPDGVSDIQGALVEPLSVALHAVSRVPRGLGGPVVVLGSGLIGQLVLQSLRTEGWDPIVAIDVDPWRLEQARACGASHVLLSGRDDIASAVRDLTAGQGASTVFDVVGTSSTVEAAVGLAAKGGAVILVGNVAPLAGLPLQLVVTREITLVGTAASSGEYPKAISLIADRHVDVDRMVSAVEPLSHGAACLTRLRTDGANTLKVVLTP